MKRFTLIAGVLLGAITLAGCVSERAEKTAKGTSISLTAGVEANAVTKTDITDPMNPIWSEGDAIGVHFVADGAMVQPNIRLQGTFTPDFVTATFDGMVTLTEGNYTMYGYYPYGSLGQYTTDITMADINIPVVQRPSATSFDAASDVMIMKPVEYSYTGEEITQEGLQFKRTMATLRVMLNSTALDGEALKSISITTNDPEINFAGEAQFDLNTGELTGFFAGSPTVTAVPTAELFANDEDAILINVPAMTLAAGTDLTISGVTESYVFERTVTVPAGGMTFTAGAFFRLGMAINAEHVQLLDYDEMLMNEWSYEGVNTPINVAEVTAFQQLPDYDGQYFSMYDAEGNVIQIYVPVAKFGQDIPLVESEDVDYWEFVFSTADVYYEGAGVSATDIAGGKMIATRDGLDITIQLATVFTDGTILKANYAGEVIDLDAPGEDIMPEANQWVYNGIIDDIDPAMTEYFDGNDALGIGTIYVYNATAEKYAGFYLPLDMLDGQTIDLLTLDMWQVEFYDDPLMAMFGIHTQMDPGGNMTSGTMTLNLDREAATVAIITDIVYSDATHFRVNYSGPITGIPAPPEETVPITSIDQLVGTWNATESVWAYGETGWAEFNADHVITITKVDDNTLNVADIMGLRALYGDPALDDDIEVEINENLEMIIPTNVELIPPMEPGTTTHLIPLAPSGTFSDGWGMPFPAQTFGVGTVSGDVVMTMNTGVVLSVFDPVLGVFGGGYCYTEAGTVWRKSAGGAAAPAVKQAPIGIRKAVATKGATTSVSNSTTKFKTSHNIDPQKATNAPKATAPVAKKAKR